jgi:hypothetical protein
MLNVVLMALVVPVVQGVLPINDVTLDNARAAKLGIVPTLRVRARTPLI